MSLSLCFGSNNLLWLQESVIRTALLDGNSGTNHYEITKSYYHRKVVWVGYGSTRFLRGFAGALNARYIYLVFSGVAVMFWLLDECEL